MLKMLTKPRRRKGIHIGPQDDGRQMSLDDFDEAIAQEGYLYELNKGVIEVSGIPQPEHAKQIEEIRNQLTFYRREHPGLIDMVGGVGEAKMLIGPAQSERHPDLSVYFDPPPKLKDVWSRWVPAIVIEVVSQRSSKRDYQEKNEEYLMFGVSEYWIVDSRKQLLTVMSRWRGQWQSKTYKPSQKFTTPLLPGLTLDLKRVFAAGK
jgi:Uma2 family endonuclease